MARALLGAAVAAACLLVTGGATLAKGRGNMTPFERAQSAFRQQVAAAHHRAPDQLKISPSVEEQQTWFESHRLRTGELLPFEAEWPIAPAPREGAREVTVRGFAGAGGEVVLEKRKNFAGALLREAHFLDEKESLPARALAERFLWMMLVELGQPRSPVGPQPPSHKLVEGGRYFVSPVASPGGGDGDGTIRPPAIARRADGSASLYFFYENLDHIGGKGHVSTRRAEVRCAKDYQAEIHVAILALDEGL